jgi:xanthine dehydrogenase iron-sulfur cluster and FAD-binding subunit A
VAFLHDEGWRSVNACLVPLPAVADREVVTVEGLASEEGLHPAQSAMVEALGSQCGYCTPGFVMSLFEATYRQDLDADWKKADQICGNLCRCTGYRPIQDALDQVAGSNPEDDFRDRDAPTLESFSVDVGDQRFYRPGTLAELYEILGREPQARLVAGATDLGLDITKKGVRFPCLVSLEGLPLAGITNEDGTWRIGATTTLSVLEAAQVHPALNQMLRFFASRQIKNRATVGGNLCNASPIGDLAPILMALEAKVVLASASAGGLLPGLPPDGDVGRRGADRGRDSRAGSFDPCLGPQGLQAA